MDLELSDDQVALQEGIASLCEGRFDIDTVRAMADTGGVDRDRWAELGETGVFSLVLDEADDGVGLQYTDAVIVFEQLGRFLVPGPLVGTFLAAGVVEGAATGQTLVGVIERAEGTGVVAFPEVIDQLLILDNDGMWLVAASELEFAPQPIPVDPLTPVARVEQLPQGERIGSAEDAEVARSRGALLTAALQLGLAVGSTELAVAYAKEREQFGKPIGAFQAVKHLCAEMATIVEVLRAAVYSAACCHIDPAAGDPAHASSVAKIMSFHVEEVARNGVQVHGGMGFTWEVDAHLFLKRSWALDHNFGDEEYHAEQVARAL